MTEYDLFSSFEDEVITASQESSKPTVADSQDVESRIKFLRHCAALYENGQISPLTDAEFDAEYYALQAIAPDHPFFNEVGGEIPEYTYGEKCKHDIIMGSLSKCLNIEDFRTYLKNTHGKNVGKNFVFQHKVDGLSLSLLYRGGKLIRAVTRGDGIEGGIVTNNAKFVAGVLETIPCQDEVEIRGECYKNQFDFYDKWADLDYANPRNFCSGSIAHKDPQVTKERELNFVAYEVVRKDFDSELCKQQFLVDQGFDTLVSSTKTTKQGLSLDMVAKAAEKYMASIKRNELPYSIDGVVVKLNDITVAKTMGSTAQGRKPKSSTAIKFPPEEKETTILDIEVNVGRTGVLTPVGILDPINLAGTTVQRVTLHNFGAFKTNKDLCIGSKVVISKQGDIIPHILKIVSKGDTPVTFPKTCPSCGEDVSWNANGVHLVCDNVSCIGQLATRIEYWFKTLGVKGIGKSIIRDLTENLEWEGHKIIENLPEMYYMLDYDRRSEHPFRKYAYLKAHFGEKAYQNIVDAVHSVKEVPLDKFIKALGIGKIGTMASEIVAIAPTIEEIDALTVRDLVKIDGFAEIKARNFVNGWKALRKEINLLSKHVKITAKKQASNKLDGYKFCFTGTFSVKRKELEAMVLANGGKIGSVGKGVTLVWDGEMAGNKLDKAKQLNLTIIDENEFMKLIYG